MKKICGAILLTLSLNLSAQDSIKVNLSEVEVASNREGTAFSKTAKTVTVIGKEEIEQSAVASINELLDYAVNVDVRQRGAYGVQADIGIRGSNFSQVLIMLNGVKMNDPQTNHHNLNLPLELMDVERIEVYHSGVSRIHGPGAFAGAINIVTSIPDGSSATAKIEGGSYGWSELAGAASISTGKHKHSFSMQRRGSDGYIRNTDFELTNLFWQSEFNFGKNSFDVNLGRNEKVFGAQNFYTARFPDQFEETQTQFASGTFSRDMGKLKFQARGYYRNHLDHFELFREDEGYYRRVPDVGFVNDYGDTVSWYSEHNNHRTDVYGAEANLSYAHKFGRTSLGFDYRSEEVISNLLGEPLDHPKDVVGDPQAQYLNGASRINRSVYIEHNANIGKLFISAGAMYNENTDFDAEILPIN